jgi:large subunit ribosomal protein L40e
MFGNRYQDDEYENDQVNENTDNSFGNFGNFGNFGVIGNNNQNATNAAKQEGRGLDDEVSYFYVKTLTGKSIALSHSDELTIANVKQQLAEIEQVPVDQQRLVYQGKSLEDAWTLSYCEVQPGASLHLVLRLKGGY